MKVEDLPVGSHPRAIEYPHFPTRHQAVVWRNWEMIPVAVLANVLQTTEDDILAIADGMGLPVPPDVESNWLARGYVTIIRANWHLLPYEQLLTLLGGWPAEKLAYHLKEEDFLWIKLGNLKPAVTPVVARPLTDTEQLQTARLKAGLHKYITEFRSGEKPFAFANTFAKPDETSSSPGISRAGAFESSYIYSYSAIYGDALMNPEFDPFPDGLLQRYADLGVGGIWLQAILYTLYPLKEAPGFSDGWQTRLANLRCLVARARAFGLNVYLYLNEPRGMPEAFFEQLPDWKGVFQKSCGVYSICTSRASAHAYLKEACAHVFREVPGLGGVFTITMSENLTHCQSKGTAGIDAPCPRCSTRSTAELVAEVNRSIAEGVHSVAPDARVVVWDWAWAPEWAHDAIDHLPADVELMCVSERGKELEIGGVWNTLRDYSISQPGPSPRSLAMWEHAARRGLKTVAKVQLNTSWECSPIPYIPVPHLVEEHLAGLRKAGVNGLMLSWTLGGFPGGNLDLLNRTPDELALADYGKNAAPYISSAWKTFADAFRNFPFSIGVLYVAPQNMGPANPLFAEKTGYNCTMVGYPYDDLERWRTNYPVAVFEEQFRKLSEQWQAGLNLLAEAERHVSADKRANFARLQRVATGVYCHFRSTFLQIRFVQLRENPDAAAKCELRNLLNEEIDLAVRLHVVVMSDSTIGFEATNHYAYTANDLREKIVNCEYLLERLCH